MMKTISILTVALLIGGCALTGPRVVKVDYTLLGVPCELAEVRPSMLSTYNVTACVGKDGKQLVLIGGPGTSEGEVATGVTQAIIVGGAIAGGAAAVGAGAREIKTGTEIIVPVMP